MHPILLGGALGFGMALMLAVPADAQRERTTHISETSQAGTRRAHMVWSDGNRSVTVVLDGDVTFTDDDADVASLASGSTLVIDEHLRGEPSRHISFRGDANGIRRSYTVDGVLSQDEPDRKAWLSRILPELIREHGLNAGPRVERILKREGPDGVLREVARIRSDGSKRTYLHLLLKNATLTPAQQVTALRLVERGMSSDGDKASVLRAMAPTVTLSHASARDAWFAAASSISSDGDRRSVLLSILSRAEADAPALAALLVSAGEISSDGDKSSVLVASADAPALEAPNARDAWFRAAGSVSSDGDRSRALRAVLAERGEFAVHALRSAREISSDGDKTRVLLAVAPDRLRDAQVAAAYDAALATISSSGDHRRAEQHLRAVRTGGQ